MLKKIGVLRGANPKKNILIPKRPKEETRMLAKKDGDQIKDLERVLLEGDVAFAKGEMLTSRELHSRAISLAPPEWQSSIQCFATRYQLARSCIEMANPSSLAQGYVLLKEMEEECRDGQQSRARFRNAVHFLCVLLYNSIHSGEQKP